MTSCRFEKNSYPSSTTWCARQMRSMSCFCRKRDTTSGPNVNDTPRSFSLQPVMSLSGSDHRRSQRRPQSGIYSGQRINLELQGARKQDLSTTRAEPCTNRRVWGAMGTTHISGTHHAADLLHRVQVRTQTTVHREDLLIDDRGDGKAVEAISERLPELDVVSAFALIVEAIDTVNRGTLVVTTEDEEVLRVLDLVCEQKANGLERLLSSVDIVT